MEHNPGMKCFSCGSINVMEYRSEGSFVCGDCATHFGKIYDEYESLYTNGECNMNNSRLGPPQDPLLPHSSMSTTIQYSSKYRKLKQIHDRSSMNYTERSLYHAFVFIEKVMETKLNLSKPVIDTAKLMYRDLKERRISRGLIHKALTAACVYFACKVHGNVKRTKQEISDAIEITTSKLNKACKIFRDLTKDRPYFNCMFSEIQLSDIIVRMVDKLHWKHHIEKWNIIKIIRAIDELLKEYGSLDNKHINSIIAALIYIASNELNVKLILPSGKQSKVNKSIICNVYDITLITLNKTINEIHEIMYDHASFIDQQAKTLDPAPK